MEATITFSRGERKPRFLADKTEQVKSSTHISVHIPQTKTYITNKKPASQNLNQESTNQTNTDKTRSTILTCFISLLFTQSINTLDPFFSYEPMNPSIQFLRLSVAFGSFSNHNSSSFHNKKKTNPNQPTKQQLNNHKYLFQASILKPKS